jgi:hypothetical protein
LHQSMKNLWFNIIFGPYTYLMLNIFGMLFKPLNDWNSNERPASSILDFTWSMRGFKLINKLRSVSVCPTREFNGFLSSCETAPFTKVEYYCSTNASLYKTLWDTSISWIRVFSRFESCTSVPTIFFTLI